MIVHEDFVGMVNIPNITGGTLWITLKDVLVCLSLPLENCRGQGYDGAANMQGRIKELATRIMNENPLALKVHCLAHSLNLCLQDITRNSQPIRDALDLAQEILQLIKLSPKREGLFKSKQESSGLSGFGNLKPLCPTRWTVRAESIKSILDNYPVLFETLEEINTTTNDEYSRRAGGQMAKMEKFSTFFGLKLGYLVFAASEVLSVNLQAVKTTVHDATKAVNLARNYYTDLRSEDKFSEFFKGVCLGAREIEYIEEPKLPRRRRVPKRVDDGSASQHFPSDVEEYYRSQYYEVLDLMNCELVDRFQSQSYSILFYMESMIIKSANQGPAEIPESLLMYSEDIDFKKLHHELAMLKSLCKVGEVGGPSKVTSMATVVDALQSLKNNPVAAAMVSELIKLVNIYLTVPVTTATSERSFSTLRRIKTYLRSTMRQDRLNNVLLLHAHKSLTDEIDLKQIAMDFVKQNDRRVKFFGNFAN